MCECVQFVVLASINQFKQHSFFDPPFVDLNDHECISVIESIDCHFFYSNDGIIFFHKFTTNL